MAAKEAEADAVDNRDVVLENAINGCNRAHARVWISLVGAKTLISPRIREHAREARTAEAEAKTAAAAKARIAAAAKAKTAVAAKAETEEAKAAKIEIARHRDEETEKRSRESRPLEHVRRRHQVSLESAHIGTRMYAEMGRIVSLIIRPIAEIGRKVTALRVSFAHLGTKHRPRMQPQRQRKKMTRKIRRRRQRS